ncbi:divalent-cation tolerance protein CutA [Rhodobacter viridis]|uniref:divalent-cation tolerance protein CutA n=1 Tax=Rhodobacter viridis TaxID=1054202 RepID=UPI000DA1A9A3|nr:divalent cation tolerance protein CutA [Rhodobacter viridis]
MTLTRILTTLPDTISAQTLGKALVTARLVACAHVSAPGTSFYIWEGQQDHSPEVQLWLKTTPERHAGDLEIALRLGAAQIRRGDVRTEPAEHLARQPCGGGKGTRAACRFTRRGPAPRTRRTGICTPC